MESLKKEEYKIPFLEKPIKVFTRSNGHKIVLAHKSGKLSNISSWVKTGSINEDENNNGVSHFLEHLMFKGTEKYRVGDFDRMLESKGAIINAATWKDYTYYYVTIPNGENFEKLNLAIDLHSDMILNATLPEEELGEPFDFGKDNPATKRERSVVCEEISMREDEPWTKVYNCVNYNMYTKHPYKRDVIGKKTTIASISRDSVFDYYKKHYTPNNITTVITGDFDENSVLNRVIEKFQFQECDNFINPDFDLDKPKKRQIITEMAEVSTGFLMYGFLGPKASCIKENLALELLSIILGEGLSSRLNQNLIEKKENSIFNIVSSVYYNFRDGGNFFVQANFKLNNEKKAISQIDEQIESLQLKISKEELEKAKKKTLVSFAKECETVSSISDLIGEYMTILNRVDVLEKYIENLNEIDENFLKETAKKFLNLDFVTICTLIKSEKK